MLEEIGVLLGGIRNYARSNFIIKISSGTWRTIENKVFGAKQAQAFRFRISTNRQILAERYYNLSEILTRADCFNMLNDAARRSSNDFTCIY